MAYHMGCMAAGYQRNKICSGVKWETYITLQPDGASDLHLMYNDRYMSK